MSLIAVLIKQSCVSFCLQQMSNVITGMTFTSREDVDAVLVEINDAFDDAEEVAADEMALVVYRTTISLHAAVTFHLYATAQPLPQMLALSVHRDPADVDPVLSTLCRRQPAPTA